MPADTQKPVETDTKETSDGMSRKVRTILLIALVAALGILIGVTGARLLSQHPGDDSAEAGFARDMSSHHAQAVEMAMLAYDKAEDPQLRSIGYDMGLTQQAQIGMMSAWLAEWKLLPTSTQPKMAWMPGGADLVEADGLMPGMASPEELEKLRNSSGREFDILFSQLMLRHHLGGIHMVDAVLKESEHPEVIEMATAMKQGQQREVTMLRTLLSDMGAQPL